MAMVAMSRGRTCYGWVERQLSVAGGFAMGCRSISYRGIADTATSDNGYCDG